MTRWIIAILTAALCAGAATGFQNPLRDRLLRNERAEETVGWFQRADTGEFFLFDRSGAAALLRERDNPTAEVYVLFANRAPGGGTSFITDTGRELIRITGLGGATYFPSDAPDGVIAEYATSAGGLVPAPRSSDEVRDQAQALVDQISRQFDRNLSISYAPAPRAGLGVQHDTLQMIGLAFDHLDAQRRRARDIETINIRIGDQPAVYRENSELIVEFAPIYGYAGRPSSASIAQALLGETEA